ncbi:bifunctional aspartate transaminase/aspartate 4-decarboxylase [Yinghuangia soli]|uniref:Aminotransferase n=1 Tax=Yinghuangia soli TaxID=2908204 RepID=A0AA41PU31_9ACTN|nr:bifunctional aspartate transaminase/aspartate 4-decarboxylase [Yinghuangia soli]MCF2525753.1 bifunctional aspartate transaminase/aspartate 4-decarboxylase [Yinghuangia soli]
MPKATYSRDKMRSLAALSPFELKAEFIKLAEAHAAAAGAEDKQKHQAAQQMLNAGRGNPNWIATGPREAFLALGHFALGESRRVWTADDLGGMPAVPGAAARFEAFRTANPGLVGVEMLHKCIRYGIDTLGFDPDTWVHELVDAYIGDNYPVPDRILTCTEQVIRTYLHQEVFDGKAAAGNHLSLFATEGGTAAMCYVFDSLMKNGILARGDRIALMVPVFTPYIEIPELDTYAFDVVEIKADLFAEDGVREWRYPESEVAKLADPSIKMVCLVNPSNPPSLALSERVAAQMAGIVRDQNPNLIVVTDDVYGTFVDGFRTIAADLPRNTILVYSYSKHFGATGWRVGVIGIHDDNVIDELIAALPDAEKARLAKRYGTLTLDPGALKFIDRMVADSRQVALNHTAGLSLPQQVQMALFSLFGLLEEGQAYKQLLQETVRRRLGLLLEGSGMTINDDPKRACYYIELDLMAQAKREYGAAFAKYLEANYEPVDALFRLAEQTSVVLLNGGGFDGPEWSIRASLANLDDLDYLKIGHHVRRIFDDYHQEWVDAGRPGGNGG